MGDTLARTETTIQIILPFLWLSKIPLVDHTGPTMSISWANYLNPPRHVDFLVTDRSEITIQIILPFLWLSKIPLVDHTGPTMSISWANYLNPPRHVDFLVTDRSDLLFQQILNLSAVIFWARPYIT